ncbi:GyrI-like domain-containing protein [Anaerosporobacter faecicola]|uniref:GyrI-like domain-containing protein n=1 Tax=Anaerosporobacter faecicola TaxID=2718714 RepID=UPI00143C47B8|nr:GyrI-like domain-containing protein [Anaerosporobacter faecicola]
MMEKLRVVYLVWNHVGPMDSIYDSYTLLYKTIIPESGYTLRQEEFLHFEQYDSRFRWYDKNSVIELWVPVM